jgi:hypothetical protein
MSRQEGRVNINAPKVGQPQHLLNQDLPVGCHHYRIGLKSLQKLYLNR